MTIYGIWAELADRLPLEQLKLFFVAILLTGCSAQAQVSPSSLPSSAMTQLPDQANNDQRLTLRLTLSAPEDLKVKEGDRIVRGQVISDRVRERERLLNQRQQLQLQIERLKIPVPGPPAPRSIPEVAGLPPASFLTEVAETERARLVVEQAERNLMQQQRKLDQLQSVPAAELPEAVIPHETEVLAQRQRDLEQAKAEQQLAASKLSKAQSDRQYQEYLHSLEMSKRTISINQQELSRQEQLQRVAQQERERSFQVAQLEAQMQTLNAQLMQLAAVRSPFNGTIRRIKYEGQTDQNLVVLLSLVADTRSRNEPTPTTSPTLNAAPVAAPNSQPSISPRTSPVQ